MSALRLAGGLAGLLIIASAALPASAQTRPAAPAQDEIAALCLAKGGTPQKCACEGRIARASFTAGERRAAVAGLSGQEEAFRAALNALGPERGRAFVAKLKTLGQRSRTQCG